MPLSLLDLVARKQDASETDAVSALIDLLLQGARTGGGPSGLNMLPGILAGLNTAVFGTRLGLLPSLIELAASRGAPLPGLLTRDEHFVDPLDPGSLARRQRAPLGLLLGR